MDVSRREFFRELVGRKSLVKLCSVATGGLESLGVGLGPQAGPEEAGLALNRAPARVQPLRSTGISSHPSVSEAASASLFESTVDSQ